MERTVKTKEEFELAIKERVERIIVIEPYAKVIIDKLKRKKKRRIWGGSLLIVASIAAAPFTFGASTAGLIAGAGLTVTALTITISAVEIAVIFAGIIGILSVIKGAKIKWDYANNTIVVEPNYKSS